MTRRRSNRAARGRDTPTTTTAGRKRVLYRWVDVEQWITQALHDRTGE
jgi:hypothetical protein